MAVEMVDWSSLERLSVIMATILGSVWSLSIWLNGKFQATNKNIYTKADDILNTLTRKIDSHEEKDDHRFGKILDDLWNVKVKIAENEGKARYRKECPDRSATITEAASRI